MGARFSATVQTGPGVHQVAYTMGTGFSPGVKQSERGVDHPPHLAPKLKKSRAIPLFPLWAFVVCSRVKFYSFFKFGARLLQFTFLLFLCVRFSRVLNVSTFCVFQDKLMNFIQNELTSLCSSLTLILVGQSGIDLISMSAVF